MRGHLQKRGADSWRLKVFLGAAPTGRSATWNGRFEGHVGRRTRSWRDSSSRPATDAGSLRRR